MTRTIFHLMLGLAMAMTSCRNQPAQREGIRAAKSDIDSDDVESATTLVADAAATVHRMKQDPRLDGLLERARALFIISHYTRGAVGIGGRRGNGTFMVRRGDTWSPPAFYDISGVGLGAQLGVEVGDYAILLMSDDAAKAFTDEGSFALNADAKFTLQYYSRVAESSTLAEDRDLVFWSGTEGAFAGVALSITDIVWDADAANAYYHEPVKLGDVMSGRMRGPTDALDRELSTL